MIRIGKYDIKSGDRVTFRIYDDQIIDSKIFISEYDLKNFRSGFCDRVGAWLCHNFNRHHGDESSNLLGYRYSWAITITRTGDISEEIIDFKPLLPGIEFKEKFDIDFDLKHFLHTNKYESLIQLFWIKIGIFDEYHRYESSKDGLILLKNDKKSVEIKLSRFIKQLSTKFNELVDDVSKLDIDDKTIEAINNKFISYQKSEEFAITFLSGSDILSGYDRNNYHPGQGGTLHKSCMVDRFDFLEIYTENPNQVKLAVVYIDKKIAARGFVWNATDGKMYSDRIYYNQDWLEDFTKEKLRKMGIDPISDHNFRTVQLEKWEFKYYPYMDNMYHFDKENGVLLNYNSGIRQLRSTNGNLG